MLKDIGFFLFVLLFLLSGCVLGPDYIRPAHELPAGSDNTTSLIAPFTAAQWWTVFHDPTLNRIEKEAIAHNRKLKLAMARVDEARAVARIAFADRLPAVGVQADAARSRSADETASAGKSRTGELFDALSLCSFEIDFWGKYKRLDEAARAELLATEAARDVIQLSLTAQVAVLYFKCRTLQSRTRIARRRLKSYAKTCALYRKRLRHGYVQEIALRRIEADRYSTEALLYQLENRLSQAQTALSVLIGRSPRKIAEGFSGDEVALDRTGALPKTPSHIPSDLLARRPDVRRAEKKLIAANARIGAARAAYFPSIALTGSYGFISSDLQDLFTDGANVWSMAGSLAQPVFEGGRLRGHLTAARARRRQMFAQYEQTVQNAFRETRDALVACTKTARALNAARARAAAMHRSFELSRIQHEHGYISVIDVLDIERQTLRAELDLADARLNRIKAVIALCKSLGGGWDEKRGLSASTAKP